VSALWQVVGRRRAAPRLLLGALLAALTYLAAIALMGLSAWLISRAAQHPNASTLALAAVGVRALGLGRAVLRYAERVVGHSVTLEVVADLRVAVFEGLVDHDDAAPDAGGLLSAVVADVDAVQDLLLRCLLPFAAGLLVLAATVTACWLLLPSAGVVLLVGLGSALLLVPALAALVARREAGLTALRAAYQTSLLEIAYASADLLVLGQLPQALSDAERAACALADVERRGSVRAAVVAGIMTLAQGATVVGVAVLGVAATSRGALSPVLLAVLVLVALAAFEPVVPLAAGGAVLARSLGSVRRLAPLVLVRVSRPVAPAPRGSILVAAGVGVNRSARPVLADVGLILTPGARVAVVGASGAGKSTLLQVLCGQLRPSEGQVLLGGEPVADLDETVRAAQVVLAEQTAHLFTSSVADNLRVGRPDATVADLEHAVTLAGLGDWVAGLPRGWDSPVGERGARISGGERKRLAVARALLSPAPILLLDEPTEGLDPIAADALVRRLVSSSGRRALVVVTHRLTALEGFDEVLVLDRGRVVQRGTADALAARPGPFHDLWARQLPVASCVG
jgi:thiol reductant ABC exporter CydC subunit